MLGRLVSRSRLSSARKSIPSWVQTLARAVISAGLIAWLALHFDWTNTWSLLIAVPWTIVLSAIGLMLLSHLLAARRLQILLAAQNISISFLFSVQLVLAGLFAGNFLPSTVGGDVVKIAWLARDQRDVTLAIASVFADRLFNLLGMLLMLPSIVVLRNVLHPRMLTRVTFGVIGLALVCLIGVGVLILLRRPLTGPTSRNRIYAAFHARFARLLSIAAVWGQRPGVFVNSLILSWSSILSSMASLYLITYYLGVDISFFEIVGVSAIVYFLTLIPISLNGLGLQEASQVYLFVSLGVLPSQALAMAVATRLLLVITSLPGVMGVSARRDSYLSSQSSVPGDQ